MLTPVEGRVHDLVLLRELRHHDEPVEQPAEETNECDPDQGAANEFVHAPSLNPHCSSIRENPNI
jgi:hypothetical protein